MIRPTEGETGSRYMQSAGVPSWERHRGLGVQVPMLREEVAFLSNDPSLGWHSASNGNRNTMMHT